MYTQSFFHRKSCAQENIRVWTSSAWPISGTSQRASRETESPCALGSSSARGTSQRPSARRVRHGGSYGYVIMMILCILYIIIIIYIYIYVIVIYLYMYMYIYIYVYSYIDVCIVCIYVLLYV